MTKFTSKTPLLKKKKYYYKNMKKFSIIFTVFISTFFLIQSQSYADDFDFWDEPMKTDQAAKSQQKAVTDTEFNKVLEMLTKKKKKKEEKNKPKGNPVWENNSPEESQNGISNVLKNMKDDYPTIMLPVTLITQNKTEIPPGYYRIMSAKNNEGYFINFYQGNYLAAKVKATETGNDYEQKSLNYAKFIPVNDDYMKIIYGDIDCNIEAELFIMNQN